MSIAKRLGRKAPGFTIDTFPQSAQEAFLREYHEKYPNATSELVPVMRSA